jgi:hypothetical protein
VFAVALAHRFADDGDLLRTALALLRLSISVRFPVLWPGFAGLREPRSKRSFNSLGVGCAKLVFERERALCPRGKGF